MKFLGILISLIVFLASIGHLLAEGNPYWSLKIGYAHSDWAQDIGSPDGAVGSIAVGWRAKTQLINLRSDFEIAGYFLADNRSHENPGVVARYESKQRYRQLVGSYIANLYIDFMERNAFRPYAGFGVGVMWIDHHGSVRETRSQVFGPTVNTGYDVGGNYRTLFFEPKIGFLVSDPNGMVSGDFSLHFARPIINDDKFLMFSIRLGTISNF